MANIHAGEVEGKEAVLHLARRLTLGDLQPLLRSAVWLFAPDLQRRRQREDQPRQPLRAERSGRRRRHTRERQGPRSEPRLHEARVVRGAGAGRRCSRAGIRDVVVDLHTTNGSYHGYHLTYAPALNPNTDAANHRRSRANGCCRRFARAMADRHGSARTTTATSRSPESLDEELEGFGAGRHAAQGLANLRHAPALRQQLRRVAQPHRDPVRGLQLSELRAPRARHRSVRRGDHAIRGGERRRHPLADWLRADAERTRDDAGRRAASPSRCGRCRRRSTCSSARST